MSAVAIRYPDGSVTLRTLKSYAPTAADRAADYTRLARACMDRMDVDQAGIYFAKAEWETRREGGAQ